MSFPPLPDTLFVSCQGEEDGRTHIHSAQRLPLQHRTESSGEVLCPDPSALSSPCLDTWSVLDRRTEFPPKAANLSLAPERAVPAFVLGPMRRGLAESVESARSAAASD